MKIRLFDSWNLPVNFHFLIAFLKLKKKLPSVLLLPGKLHSSSLIRIGLVGLRQPVELTELAELIL